MALNVTTAVFGENCNTATASPSLAQWDKGQVLQISGVDLPDAYQVEFSTVYTRNAIPVIGNASGVQVPNELLQRSAPITACVVLHSTANSRETEYWVTIHITPRKPPETITPDPEQQDVIDQTIAALQDGTARAEAAATSAEGSANDAEAAAEAVQNLSVAAETLATGEPATVEKTMDEETGAVTLTFGLPRGVKGDPLTYEDLTPEQKAELVQGPILEAQDSAVTAVGNARASAVDAVGSAGTTAVNAVNQAGTTQTAAVNQAGTTQVAAVNQAGTTQVQAVTDKGAEVIGSIPSDYSDLADDVADLSRQISDKSDGRNLFNKDDVSNNRAYNVNNNATETTSTTIRSNAISVNAGDTIVVNKFFTTNAYGFNFLNQDKTQLIAAAYSDGFHRRIKVPEGAAYTHWTVLSSDINDFTMEIVPQVKAMIEDTVNESNPFCRKTLKDQLYQDNGFWHCAFPSVALFAGKEVVAYRASQSHLTPVDTANWGGVILKTRTSDGVWSDLGLLDTSGYSFNGELRDPCLTVSRDGKTLFMSCFTTYRDASAPTVDLHDNVLFTLDTDLKITSCVVISNAANVFFGNTLVTPEGYLLHSAYKTGTIYLYRSTTAFSGTLTGMQWGEPVVIATTGSATECTLGYWNDLLVVIFRRDDNNNCRFNFTRNLEGTDGWKPAASLIPIYDGFSLHAPVLLPYWSGIYLPFAGAKWDSANNRYAISGMISKDDSDIFWFKCWNNVDTDQCGNSGYCGLAYFGGDEFSIPYYRESGKSFSTLNASTGMYYKHFHMRALCPEMAYI